MKYLHTATITGTPESPKIEFTCHAARDAQCHSYPDCLCESWTRGDHEHEFVPHDDCWMKRFFDRADEGGVEPMPEFFAECGIRPGMSGPITTQWTRDSYIEWAFDFGMTNTPDTLTQIEQLLAEMLDFYAGLRETYVANPDDIHALRGSDRDIAAEVGGLRQAAKLLRGHRDDTSGMSLPSRRWGEWTAMEREVSRRLAGLTTPLVADEETEAMTRALSRQLRRLYPGATQQARVAAEDLIDTGWMLPRERVPALRRGTRRNRMRGNTFSGMRADLPGTYLALLDTDTPTAAARAARIRAWLHDPASAISPHWDVTGQAGQIRAALPAWVTAAPDADAAIELAARGLAIMAVLYPDPAVHGRAGLIIGELEHPGHGVLATYHHAGGILDAITALARHLHTLGADPAAVLDAVAAEAFSDAVYGNGRSSDNPTGYDELRAAQLAHAHAKALRYSPERADRIRSAVLGTAFNEHTKSQAGHSDPDPVVQAVAGVDLHVLSQPDAIVTAIELAVEDGMSARWSPQRILGRALHEHGIRARTARDVLEFVDAHPQLAPDIEGEPAEQTVREMLAHRLIGNAGFIAAHRYPPTWTLDDPDRRAANAAEQRRLGTQLLTGEITAVQAYDTATAWAGA